MKKNPFFLIIFSVLFCTSLSAKQMVLERNVTNHVQRYHDEKWFDESGLVRIYLNEFTNKNDPEKKFGWAFAIKSNMLGGYKTLNGEDKCPLMYYIDGDHFYIGEVWTNGYQTEVTKTHVFFDFNKEDGYGVLFMYAYALAVNRLLTYGNNITFCVPIDKDGHNKFITNDSENDVDVSFNTGDFPEYRNYSKFRMENGDVDGEKVYLDGEWRNILNKKYVDQSGMTWKAFYDEIGFHVQKSRNCINWAEPVVFPAFRTVRMRLVKPITRVETKNGVEIKIGSSQDAGIEIAANLKEHGLWKARTPMRQGDGTLLGANGGTEGVITCWYEPFTDSEGPSKGLEEKEQKDQLIKYEKVVPKKLD
ncbi:hypothetical protein [uncultured Treponema sp.]|uniref:hypothetical protein n=1 Tax=uncultured Treponema sp. TaxID=162155 RepID=UPI0025859886|nr:hypothetical protein [uncultured Treponema sp.]